MEPNAQQNANRLNPQAVTFYLPSTEGLFRAVGDVGGSLYRRVGNKIEYIDLTQLLTPAEKQAAGNYGAQVAIATQRLKEQYGFDPSSVPAVNMGDLSSVADSQGLQVYRYAGPEGGPNNYVHPTSVDLNSFLGAKQGTSLSTKVVNDTPNRLATPEEIAAQMKDPNWNGGSTPAQNNTQTPQSSFVFPQATLKPGDTGDGVKELQDFLVQHGYMTQAEVNTGYGTYGPKTKAAVALMQSDLGVDAGADAGFYGPKTKTAIQTYASSVSQGTSTPPTDGGLGGGTDTGGTPVGGSPTGGNPFGNTGGYNSDTGTGSGANFDNLIQSNPLLSEQLKDPAKKAQFDALPDDLKMIYLETMNSLSKAVEAGKVINPNITITPEDNAKLLEQARTELSPYYQEKLDAYKSDFTTSISRLMEDFNKFGERRDSAFKETLGNQAESEAQSGTAFSSGRVDRKERAINLEQNTLDDAFTQTTRGAQDKATTLERNIGSNALRSLNIPGLSGYTASGSGVSKGPVRTLYTPLGTTPLGELEKSKTVDIENRRSQLESALRSSRILDTTKLT